MPRPVRPCIVSRERPGEPCARLPRLDLSSELTEGWLQELLDAHPDILDVERIDGRVRAPLLSLGREIATPDGPIDNLFLCASGHLVVVETKLWRNPEARRKVVAQVLDYAKTLRSLDYEKIQELFARRHGAGSSLWESAHESLGVSDEAEWIDQIQRNTSAGRMTLLIVGDGIRSSARDLAEVISGHPGLPFRLGLVELRLHQVADGRILVIPSTVAKTVEVERAVVRIVHQGTPPAGLDVQVEVPRPPSRSKASRAPRTAVLNREQFLEDFCAVSDDNAANADVIEHLLDLLEDSTVSVEWKPKTFNITTPNPLEPGESLILANVQKSPAKVSLWSGFLRDGVRRSWGDEVAAQELVDALLERGLAAGGEKTGTGVEVKLTPEMMRGHEEKLVKALEEMGEEVTRRSVGVVRDGD